MMAAICFVSNELIPFIFSKLRYLPVRHRGFHFIVQAQERQRKTCHFDGSHVIAYHRIIDMDSLLFKVVLYKIVDDIQFHQRCAAHAIDQDDDIVSFIVEVGQNRIEEHLAMSLAERSFSR